MLVSHGFVELFRIIVEDHSFDKALFASLTEGERDFMQYLFKKCKMTSREFESAYNQTISRWVDRLNMIHNAIKIGDDNPTLREEMTGILDKLYDKGVFSHQFYMQFKKAVERSSNQGRQPVSTSKAE
ncbi:hypothetical protein BBJ28_00011917 [Nothophytophthora sp. Chile5]|nr:hypothetical protein BBJ28_00011917 [Nothophytophthora sp. Chile5]